MLAVFMAIGALHAVYLKRFTPPSEVRSAEVILGVEADTATLNQIAAACGTVEAFVELFASLGCQGKYDPPFLDETGVRLSFPSPRVKGVYPSVCGATLPTGKFLCAGARVGVAGVTAGVGWDAAYDYLLENAGGVLPSFLSRRWVGQVFGSAGPRTSRSRLTANGLFFTSPTPFCRASH